MKKETPKRPRALWRGICRSSQERRCHIFCHFNFWQSHYSIVESRWSALFSVIFCFCSNTLTRTSPNPVIDMCRGCPSPSPDVTYLQYSLLTLSLAALRLYRVYSLAWWTCPILTRNSLLSVILSYHHCRPVFSAILCPCCRLALLLLRQM